MDDSVGLVVKYGELWQKEIALQNRLEKLEKQQYGGPDCRLEVNIIRAELKNVRYLLDLIDGSLNGED